MTPKGRTGKSRRYAKLGCFLAPFIAVIVILALIAVRSYLQAGAIAKLQAEQERIRAELQATPHPVDWEDWVARNPLPEDEENGAGAIQEALSLLRAVPLEHDLLVPYAAHLDPPAPHESYAPECVAAMKALVEKNQPALEAYARGISKAGVFFPEMEPQVGSEAYIEFYGRLRTLRNTLRVGVDFAIASGDAGTYLNAQRLLATTPKLFAHDLGRLAASSRMGAYNDYCAAVERALNHLELKPEALDEIGLVLDAAEPFRWVRDFLIPITAEDYPVTIRDYLITDFPGIVIAHLPSSDRFARAYAGRDYEAHNLRLLENVKLAFDGCAGSWSELAPVVEEREALAEAENSGMGAFTEGDAFRGLRELFRTRAHLRLTRLALAVEVYRMDNEFLPAKLNELKAANPDLETEDPYDGKAIRYRSDTRGYVLYCVGENLADDGGVQYHKRAEQERSGDLVFAVHPEPGNLSGTG